MRHVVVMFHDVRLLTTALYADKYLIVQIKFAVGWLNKFEPQLPTTWSSQRDDGGGWVTVRMEFPFARHVSSERGNGALKRAPI